MSILLQALAFVIHNESKKGLLRQLFAHIGFLLDKSNQAVFNLQKDRRALLNSLVERAVCLYGELLTRLWRVWYQIDIVHRQDVVRRIFAEG